MRGMELWRPDWVNLMTGCGGVKMDANELVSVTRETARLAMSAIQKQNAEDYYHNFGAALHELRDALDPPKDR